MIFKNSRSRNSGLVNAPFMGHTMCKVTGSMVNPGPLWARTLVKRGQIGFILKYGL